MTTHGKNSTRKGTASRQPCKVFRRQGHKRNQSVKAGSNGRVRMGAGWGILPARITRDFRARAHATSSTSRKPPARFPACVVVSRDLSRQVAVAMRLDGDAAQAQSERIAMKWNGKVVVEGSLEAK